MDNETTTYFSDALRHIPSFSAYYLFVFMILVFAYISHLCLFLVRWWLTIKIIKSIDYIYFLLIIVSLIRIINQYSNQIDLRIDLLSYTIIAAAIGIRLSRTSAEVFAWDEYNKLKIRRVLPIFASRNKLIKRNRILRNTCRWRINMNRQYWLRSKWNDPHWRAIFARANEVESEFTRKWTQAKH